MDRSLEEQLRTLSKDDAAFAALQELYAKMEEQQKKVETHLNLLENAIKDDYDAIIITELALEKPGPQIVYANDGFTRITGYSRKEVIGKTPRILQGPKTDKSVFERQKSCLKSGRAFFGQAVNYRKDGSEFINQWDIHPLTDKEGNITHWISYHHDITERKKAERVVVDARLEFDKLHEHSKCIFVDINTSGNILFANKALRDLIGYHKDELRDTPLWRLVPEKHRAKLKAQFEKSFDKETFHQQAYKGIITHRKGFPIQVEGSSSVLNLQEQTIIRVDIKNVSLQKRIMEKLQNHYKDFKDILDSTIEFSYRIALKEGKPQIEYVSDGFTKVTGLSKEEATQPEGVASLIHPDDLEKVHQYWERVIAGTASGTCEYRIHSPAGGYQPIIDYGKPDTCKKNGEEPCVRGSIRFKASEEAMEQDEG